MLSGIEIEKDVFVGDRVLFIDDFQSGQSFEIFFSKEGVYEICYSNVKQIKSLRTCLKVDVVKAKSV